jgi:hypothetical protein
LTFDEVDAIRTSLDLLDARPDVDPSRVGVVGLSASGGLGIVAAGQADLRDRIRFVNSFGSYADATTLLLDVASRSMSVDGQVRAWQPEPRTIQVVTNAMRDVVPNVVLKEFQSGTTRLRAESALKNLPSAAHERLDRVSPSTYLKQVRAHLYLMHDQDDPFIPFTESRTLASTAPQGVVQRYTEFAIFAHVIPEKPVPWQTFLPDVWRLFWHVHAVLLEVL